MLRRWVTASLLLVVAACSSGGRATTPTTAPTTTSTTTSTSTTTTTTIPLVGQPSPSAAAQALIEAWKAGDRLAASTIGTAEAVDALFAAGDPGSTEARGCADAQFSPASCVYRTDPGEVQIRTVQGTDGTWTVDQVRVTPA